MAPNWKRLPWNGVSQSWQFQDTWVSTPRILPAILKVKSIHLEIGKVEKECSRARVESDASISKNVNK